MKPTIEALEKRIKEHAEIFSQSDYHLIRNCDRNLVYLVDTSAPAWMAVFTHIDVKYLCEGFIGYFNFEVVRLGESDAKKCGCEKGDYLCISFIVE